MPEIGEPLRAAVRDRANRRCEYCRIPEIVSLVLHEVDHIVATKHGGTNKSENLALCCTLCNRHKGPTWPPSIQERVSWFGSFIREPTFGANISNLSDMESAAGLLSDALPNDCCS